MSIEAMARAFDLGLDLIARRDEPAEPEIHDPIRCGECDGTDRDCFVCDGTGLVVCQHCGEAPATVAHHWFRTQPNFKGDAIDHICADCALLTVYSDES